ncbi:unnamed protein product [Zymoseptoria tritici ST99CH_3D1]|nr:unnamed protein product [Zymoseptoria tritici ST99CH_3D1]
MGWFPLKFKKAKKVSNPPADPVTGVTPYTRPNTTVTRLTRADRTLDNCLPPCYESRLFTDASQVFLKQVDRERFMNIVKIVLSQNGTQDIDSCTIDLYYPRQSWIPGRNYPLFRATFAVTHPESSQQLRSTFSAAHPGETHEEAFVHLVAAVELRFAQLAKRQNIRPSEKEVRKEGRRGRQMGLEGGACAGFQQGCGNGIVAHGGRSVGLQRRERVKVPRYGTPKGMYLQNDWEEGGRYWSWDSSKNTTQGGRWW